MKLSKYNWKGTGPHGCDSHCIPHPCGPCTTEKSSQMHYERDFFKSAYEEVEGKLRDYLVVQTIKEMPLLNARRDIKNLKSKIAVAVEALEFYAAFADGKNTQFIFDDEISSRGQVYEQYKKYSIGDVGIQAAEALAKIKAGA